jgi:hypothetical protein
LSEWPNSKILSARVSWLWKHVPTFVLDLRDQDEGLIRETTGLFPVIFSYSKFGEYAFSMKVVFCGKPGGCHMINSTIVVFHRIFIVTATFN